MGRFAVRRPRNLLRAVRGVRNSWRSPLHGVGWLDIKRERSTDELHRSVDPPQRPVQPARQLRQGRPSGEPPARRVAEEDGNEVVAPKPKRPPTSLPPLGGSGGGAPMPKTVKIKQKKTSRGK